MGDKELTIIGIIAIVAIIIGFLAFLVYMSSRKTQITEEDIEKARRELERRGL